MTRAKKFNEKRQKEYFDLLKAGLRRTHASESVGVCYNTIYRERKSNPEFAEAEALAELEACDMVEDALYNEAIKGNVRAIEVWLYNRYPERWKERRGAGFKQEITTVVDSGKDELREIVKILEEALKEHPEIKVDLSKVLIRKEK